MEELRRLLVGAPKRQQSRVGIVQHRKFLVPIFAILLVGVAVQLSIPKAHGNDALYNPSLTFSGFLTRAYYDPYLSNYVDAILAGSTLTLTKRLIHGPSNCGTCNLGRHGTASMAVTTRTNITLHSSPAVTASVVAILTNLPSTLARNRFLTPTDSKQPPSLVR